MSKQNELAQLADAVTVDGSNVGIGTSPSAKLHVANATTEEYIFETTNNNTRSQVEVKSKDSSGNAVQTRIASIGDGVYGMLYTLTNHNLTFATNNAAPQMTLDTSGRVTMPYQPAFLAHGNSGTYYSVSTLGGGSYIPFANAVTNIGNCFNPSNSRFSAPVAGMYHFDVAVYTRTGSATEDIYPRWRVNNSSNKGYAYWYNTTGSEVHHTITDSINIYLNAGDDIGVTINGHASSDIHLGFQESRFSGYLIG